MPSFSSDNRVRRGCLTRLPHTRLGRLARKATRVKYRESSIKTTKIKISFTVFKQSSKVLSNHISHLFQVRDDRGRARVLRHCLRSDAARILLRPQRRKLQLNLRQVQFECKFSSVRKERPSEMGALRNAVVMMIRCVLGHFKSDKFLSAQGNQSGP